jgi:hypothetical protein
MESITHASWLDPLTLWLVIIIFIIYAIEFLIGKQGQKVIRNQIEDFWCRLEDVKWVRLGFEEAKSFLSFFDRVFGARLLSWKRLFSCTILCGISIAVFYSLVETLRYYYGLNWRPPFTSFHYNTGFPFQIFPMMLYISITRYFTESSIRWFEFKKFGTVKFILFLIFFNIASYMLVLSGLSTVFGRIFMWFTVFPELVNKSSYDDLLEAASRMLSWGGFLNTLINAMHIKIVAIYDWVLGTKYSEQLGDALTPLIYPDTSLAAMEMINQGALGIIKYAAQIRKFDIIICSIDNLERCAKYDAYQYIAMGFYTSFMEYVRFFIRLIFAIIFIGSWIFLRPLRWFISLLLLRLAESEKGVLSLIAVLLVGLVKLIQMLIATKS